MTVEKMVKAAAVAMSDWESIGWARIPRSERVMLGIQAENALKSLGIPLETLAALKAGTWKPVPVEPTAEMFDAWSKQGGSGNLAAQWAATLAALASGARQAVPDVPGDAE